MKSDAIKNRVQILKSVDNHGTPNTLSYMTLDKMVKEGLLDRQKTNHGWVYHITDEGNGGSANIQTTKNSP